MRDSPSPPSLLDVAVWLTGLPCAGKSTIAQLVADGVRAAGGRPRILDGDALRAGRSRDLGFSAADRHEQARRAAHAALQALAEGEVPIVATVSPYRTARAQARDIVGPHRFLEVYVDAPAEICERRDVKGHYAAARAGRIPAFTGVSDPYQPPLLPALRLDTTLETAEASAGRVLALVVARASGDRAGRITSAAAHHGGQDGRASPARRGSGTRRR